MLDIERAKRAAITQCAERLCRATKARNDAVRERLGLSVQPDPSPQPPFFPRMCLKSPRQGQRFRPLLPPLNVEGIKRTLGSPERLEEDDSFWETVLGGQMAAGACQEAQMADRDSPTASFRSTSRLSSVDAHTPTELRAISRIGSPVEATFTPPRAVPLFRSRVSHLPDSSKLKRAGELL